eukprot:CAMPEP_0176050154 /NCGR_PEP_ID=MMETSP0120_2-20121206/24927_1 /TAXON_ID=160619 /ORGANISM="Kryptoperidinium foliaceum, Strain CCMP 1326" /LENGTH=663 /DNA_ID=CAMNT_0017383587 /DNA_START=111 /DNA_END=2102 /DNA_ORIENTATION=-
MKFSTFAVVSVTTFSPTSAFTQGWCNQAAVTSRSSPLHVSIGLGPDKEQNDDVKELVPGVDYEVPDHESYRTSRRSKLDEQCDKWFESLMGGEDGVLGPLVEDARSILTTPVPLVNEEELPRDHEEWTPYVSPKLPWTPLTPSFGLEQFGLPIPRRNAETWRHFDVAGMVEQDYSGNTQDLGKDIELSDDDVASYQKKLEEQGGWLADDMCQARLVYINGRFAPQLSKSNQLAMNLHDLDTASDEVKEWLGRLTDGFSDQLVAPVPVGDNMYWDSYKKLSGPDHAIGEPTSQFAINTQQGTACFVALNTMKTGAVACVQVPKDHESESETVLPILVVNAVTKDAGGASGSEGVAMHPRCIVVAEENSKASFVQSCVDLDSDAEYKPKMYNGVTQMFVKQGAKLTHSFLEESGGRVVPGVEKGDDELKEGEASPRELEAARAELKDTHLETFDVHLLGDDANYEGTLMSVGGSGRVRIAHSVSLLQPGTHAKINGFSLCGGAQRSDCKTNIHHIAQGTSSEQMQKNMIGGRATGAFRGRIRVEQSAQQTDSAQLSRTVLLSDKSRAWAVPSLEIIADDVQCTHGATVSDLSEEELFYLRSRGLDRTLARNLLMYAFAGDVCSCIEPTMLDTLGSNKGLQKRLIERLENVVPQGDRAIKGEFQSI